MVRHQVSVLAQAIAGTFDLDIADELEEQIAAVGDRQVADLIDDEQRGAAEPADTLAQLALALGPG
jgi:hypothetical protein